MKNILVTGAGALLGQGILRCLDASENPYHIVSADPDVRSTGHALAAKSYVIPFAKSLDFISRIEEIIVKENINVVLIGTDVELPVFAEHKDRLEAQYGLKVIVSNKEVIDIANDKWLTAEFLRKNDFPYPLSALTTDADKMNELKARAIYPLIAKPVDGARSMGIEIIQNEEDLKRVCSYKNNLVVQEMLSADEGEFTTGCIVINGKCKAIVSLTRDLRDGNTWRAYRNGPSPYDETIAAIAEKLGVDGPANFQYRIRNGVPVIFEINGRFSGTTPLRMMFGFNEVEALIEYYCNNTPITQPKLSDGVVLRTFSDIFVPNEMLQSFKENGYTESYQSQYHPFKRLK